VNQHIHSAQLGELLNDWKREALEIVWIEKGEVQASGIERKSNSIDRRWRRFVVELTSAAEIGYSLTKRVNVFGVEIIKV
jgi:hypothetical protein